jgi:hypothetical protein
MEPVFFHSINDIHWLASVAATYSLLSNGHASLAEFQLNSRTELLLGFVSRSRTHKRSPMPVWALAFSWRGRPGAVVGDAHKLGCTSPIRARMYSVSSISIRASTLQLCVCNSDQPHLATCRCYCGPSLFPSSRNVRADTAMSSCLHCARDCDSKFDSAIKCCRMPTSCRQEQHAEVQTSTQTNLSVPTFISDLTFDIVPLSDR